MKAKLLRLILSLGALLLSACSLTMAPPPGDFNISARMNPLEYVVNGAPRPDLTLTRGLTYTFSVNASGHPFLITTDPTGGPGASQNVPGVSGGGVSVGIVTFTPDNATMEPIYYQCGAHPGMGNAIHLMP